MQFDMIVKEFSFIKNMDKLCAYKKASESALVFLILYIEEILFIGNDIPMLQSIKT